MDEIISHFSVRSLKNSVALPVHEPISFGFEEMLKANAEAIRQELIELGKGHGGVQYSTSERVSDDTLTDPAHSEYIYDYNLVAELSELKRTKNRK